MGVVEQPGRQGSQVVRIRALIVAMMLVAGLAPHAEAQFAPAAPQPGSGGSGMFGGRNLGGAFSPAASQFMGTLTGTGVGGRGGTVAGRTQQADNAGQITGSDRFLRSNRQQGQFVGSDAADIAGFIGALGAGRNQTIDAGSARRSQQTVNSQSSMRAPQHKYRTTRSIGFDVPEKPSTEISESFQRHLEKLPPGRSLPGVTMEVQGRLAILRGEVATDRDRALVEQLARLEVGISQVQNELTVKPATPPMESP